MTKFVIYSDDEREFIAEKTGDPRFDFEYTRDAWKAAQFDSQEDAIQYMAKEHGCEGYTLLSIIVP